MLHNMICDVLYFYHLNTIYNHLSYYFAPFTFTFTYLHLILEKKKNLIRPVRLSHSYLSPWLEDLIILDSKYLKVKGAIIGLCFYRNVGLGQQSVKDQLYN